MEGYVWRKIVLPGDDLRIHRRWFGKMYKNSMYDVIATVESIYDGSWRWSITADGNEEGHVGKERTMTDAMYAAERYLDARTEDGDR